jgi:hypothetical protein
MLKVKTVTNSELRQDEPQELLHAPARKPTLTNPAFQIIVYSAKHKETLNEVKLIARTEEREKRKAPPTMEHGQSMRVGPQHLD